MYVCFGHLIPFMFTGGVRSFALFVAFLQVALPEAVGHEGVDGALLDLGAIPTDRDHPGFSVHLGYGTSAHPTRVHGVVQIGDDVERSHVTLLVALQTNKFFSSLGVDVSFIFTGIRFTVGKVYFHRKDPVRIFQDPRG